MLEHSQGRVPWNTATRTNVRIKDATRANIERWSARPTAIPQRLKELDREWDVERTLITLSSGLTLAAALAVLGGRRRAFLVPLVVQGFMMLHALQGWCPPLPLLRRLGFRTPNEIERERCALKDALRDDNADRTVAPASPYRGSAPGPAPSRPTSWPEAQPYLGAPQAGEEPAIIPG